MLLSVRVYTLRDPAHDQVLIWRPSRAKKNMKAELQRMMEEEDREIDKPLSSYPTPSTSRNGTG